ncbi:MAG: adenylosuccinate synthase [Planctomycetota bacterium]
MSSNHPATKAASAVVGLQWGDEGKGKLIDLLAAEHDAVVRYNGGANAGHSVVIDGQRFALHLVPCGVFHEHSIGVIGNGVVIDPVKLVEELEELRGQGFGVAPERLAISDRAHVVMPYHKAEDALREEVLTSSAAGSPKVYDQAIGTTRRGIGPAYSDKANRATAIRMGDLLRPEVLREKLERVCYFKNVLLGSHGPIEGQPHEPLDPASLAERYLAIGDHLRAHIVDTTYLLHDMLHEGRRLLFEGANATLLDVDHGTYPYVTSSNCSSLGIPAGSGVPGRWVGAITGVLKAYSTRVGSGPFPTELADETGDRIRERGREFGTTTGRPRRCGWLDLVAVRYSAMVNGVDELGLTLLDVLSGFDELKVCVAYRLKDGSTTERFLPDASALAGAEPVYEVMTGWDEDITAVRHRADLPGAARQYVELIEAHARVPITTIGVGPDRAQTVR